jgi:integrative and conjugative element protein (TIGR02256 family)
VALLFETWIARTALGVMSAEADARFPLETGGVLVGYRSANHQVIMAVTGPGPAAIHGANNFHPDHDWQCSQLDLQYKRSGGVLVYLGEWHTHPNESGRMSATDRATLARIAKSGEANARHPVMLIGAGTRDHWEWMANVYLGGGFLNLFPRIQSAGVRSFHPLPRTDTASGS